MDAQERLRPYVPGFVVDWLRERPEVRHRSVDGSLVFVDVSGFTALTEKLADRGKVGAEEMTALLDGTFAELLSVAYSYGAWLVKWGGDAVLLLFQGDGHAERACTAALGMRRTMGRVGRLRTSVGPVRLRVSMGVHSGAFDFFLVGSTHRELVITGPGASVTAECEAAAAAGQVAVSPATAALLPERLLERLGDVVLLARSPRAPSSTALRPVDTVGVDLRTCLPEVTWRHLLTADDDAEHRLVSVAFVQFSGMDALLVEQGPGAATAAVDTVVRACQEAAVRHGVTFWETDINRDGGKVMLVGGVPASTGADEDAMLAVARDVVETDGPLRVRVGVNAGRVFFGQFGPSFRRTMSVKGDAVNLAARVMGKAAQGEVLAPSAVLDRSRTPFAVEALPPFRVKGKTHPVTAVRVGPPHGALQDTPAGGAGPFVGRRRELDRLVAEWRVARHGQLRACDVVGEPGVGKSRLLQELVRAVQAQGGAHVVAVACDPYTASTAYAPVVRALRGLLGVPPQATSDEAGAVLLARLRDAAPELLPWAPLLATVVDGVVPGTPEVAALDERFRAVRREEATADLLQVLLPGPTVLAVDDAHLLDPSSAALLDRLPHRAGGAPWLVLRCGRDEEQPAADERAVLRLGPLDPSAALELLQAVTDDAPLPAHAAAAVVRRSGGNPLFVVELGEAAAHPSGLDDLPGSVEGVVAARIDRLPPADRKLLRAAALVGRDVDLAVLASLGARTGEAFDVDALVRLDSFVEAVGPGTFRFRQALVQETAYEGLPYSRRTVLHGHLGDVLAERSGGRTGEIAATLSLHFLRAERWGAAWRFARAAADRARASVAHAEAAELYARAVTAGRHLPELGDDLGRACEALGDALYRVGQFRAAAEAYGEARRLLRGTALDTARLHHRAALCAGRTGGYRQALRWLSTGRRLLESAGSGRDVQRQAAELLVARAEVRHWQGRHADAARECRRAVEAAERAEAVDLVADALVWLDVSRLMLGEGDGAEARRSLSIWEDLADRPWNEGRCLNELGIRAYYAGDWDEAQRLYRRCEAANVRAGDSWAASVAQGNAAEILLEQGRLDEAEPLLRDALRVWRASGSPGQVAFGVRLLGTLAGRRGDAASAAALLAEARAAYVALGEDGEVVETDIRLAESALLAGDATDALARVADVLSAVQQQPAMDAYLPSLHRLHGLALAAAGDVDAGRTALATGLAAARARGAEHEVAFTLHARVSLDRLSGQVSDEYVRASEVLLRRLGIRAVAEPVLRPTVKVPPQPRPGELETPQPV